MLPVEGGGQIRADRLDKAPAAGRVFVCRPHAGHVSIALHGTLVVRRVVGHVCGLNVFLVHFSWLHLRTERYQHLEGGSATYSYFTLKKKNL